MATKSKPSKRTFLGLNCCAGDDEDKTKESVVDTSQKQPDNTVLPVATKPPINESTVMVFGKPRITFTYNPANAQPPTHYDYDMRHSMMSYSKPGSITTTQYQSVMRPVSQGYEPMHDMTPISNFLLTETKTLPKDNTTAQKLALKTSDKPAEEQKPKTQAPKS